MKATVYHGPRDMRVEGIGGSDLHMYRLGMFVVLRRPVTNEVVLTP